MAELDRSLSAWVVDHRVGLLDPIFQGLSLIGSFGLLWLLIEPGQREP